MNTVGRGWGRGNREEIYRIIGGNLRKIIGNAKSFFRYDTCSKNPNPPQPPFSKGGNLAKFL
jgi:hypothetical protein